MGQKKVRTNRVDIIQYKRYPLIERERERERGKSGYTAS